MPANPHSSSTLADVLVTALRRWGDRIAFDDLTRTYTYRETADLVARITRVLERDRPLKGRGVGVLSVNDPRAWMVVAAVKIAGGYVTALPALGAPRDIAHFVADSDLSTLVVHPALAEVGADALAIGSNEPVVYSLGDSELAPDLWAAAAAEPSSRLTVAPGIEADDMCQIFYTGGTTALPKGAVHTHRTWLAQIAGLPHGLQMPHAPRYLAAAPISHQGYPWMAPTLFGGGTIVTIPRFEPELFARTVADRRITFTSGVPTMIYALLDHLRTDDVDLSSLRSYVYGASPMSVDRLAEAHERIGRVFTQGYGTIEALGNVTVLPPALHDPARPDRLGSAGVPVINSVVAVLDDDGNELGDGERGEICVRSPAVMREYRNQPEETELVFRHGWLHTGDIGVRDGDGFYTLVDRKKDVIISGGYNVYSAEIERIISAVDAVSNVAVIGLPDPRWGEAVTAVVTEQPGRRVDTEAVRGAVRAAKGSVHTPKSVRVVPALPVTPVGKVDKRALRQALLADEKPAEAVLSGLPHSEASPRDQ